MAEIKLITVKAYKALKILKDHPDIRAEYFAQLMWGDTDTNMFTSSKNTGNGACRGKAAWLCAGSYIGRLKKKGLANNNFEFTGYRITSKGKEEIKRYELKNNING